MKPRLLLLPLLLWLLLCTHTISAQDFLQKYPTLTNENLNDFIADWYGWSCGHQKQNRSKEMDILFKNVFEYYGERCKNNGEFLVLLSDVVVSSYDSVFTDKMRYEDGEWGNKTGEISITPVLESKRKILYLNLKIRTLLDNYVGGIHTSSYHSELLEINEEHLANLRKFIPVVEAHDTGYWYYCSMPIIYGINKFKNGYYTIVRTNFNNSDAIFINTKGNKQEIEYLVSYAE